MTVLTSANCGLVSLGGHDLTIGSNDQSTIFSGVIQDGGVIKSGSGTLTLSGANTYSGSTTVTGGVLQINNERGSATGTGSVYVNAGALGGRGISGPVTIGTGSGSGAILAQADEVIAKGVTIASGAQFALQTAGNKKLSTGAVFTVISNTSATPISGTFSNLPNGGLVNVNGNNFQASYSGGDGNDLTLTVVL